MKYWFMVLLMTLSFGANAQSWESLVEEGNATYLGGYWAAVSYGCLKTDYTNDSGVWASGDATIQYEKGCARAVWDALTGRVTPYGES